MTWNSQLIVGAFADAAVDPSKWSEAMDVAARETESVGAFVLPVIGKTPNIPFSESLRASIETYFRDGWHQRDARFQALPMLKKYGAVDDFDWTNYDQMRRDPYFQEFLRPLGLQFFGCVKMAAGDDLWAVSIQRSSLQDPFSASEKRRLAELSPQISTAAAVARALGFSAANAVSEAFELSGTALALLNRRHEVVRLNRPAEALFVSDLRCRNRRILCGSREATNALDRALHALLWNGRPSGLSPPVALPRQGKRPILAYPLKLASLSANFLAECQCLLALVDLETIAPPAPAELRSALGLTNAEARLASLLAAGATLESISEKLSISKETARGQIKSIFDKTGTHKQGELIAVLSHFLRGS